MKKILHNINKPINNLKIANKMMFIYVVGGFIPLLLLSFFLIGNTRSILIDQATQEALNNTNRIEERLLDIFRISIDVSDGIYLDDQLKQMIDTQYTDQFDVINALMTYTKMDEYLRLYPELDSIRIYVDNQTLLDNSQVIPLKQVHIENDWYQLAIKENGRIAFIYRYDEIKRGNYLSLVRLIKNDQGEEYGVLVVNISNRSLRKLTGSEPYEVVGILDNQRVFISTQSDYEGLYLDDDDTLQLINNLPYSINNYSKDGIKYKVISGGFETHSSGSDIRILTLIPIENFLGFANKSIINSIALISVSVILALFMVYLLTKRLSGRIEEFRRNLHKVATGDFEIDYDIGDSDEIGLLFTDLQIMTESIKNLIHKVYEVDLQKEQMISRQREVEFKMLTSQIDPHFLYNTLETIRMEAVINDQNHIAEVVQKLASIMRRKLSVSNDEVSLTSELNLLSSYLEIQKFRFRDRVSYVINELCDPDEYMILPLLLQPIVENAFTHGLENKVEPGSIEITISESELYLEILIEDNGTGIPEGALIKLKEKMNEDLLSFKENIGLMNVYQRIQIFYQSPYHLEIESEEGHGTKVKFYLPKRNSNTNIKGAVDVQSNLSRR